MAPVRALADEARRRIRRVERDPEAVRVMPDVAEGDEMGEVPAAAADEPDPGRRSGPGIVCRRDARAWP
jgi:hypothetical protein